MIIIKVEWQLTIVLLFTGRKRWESQFAGQFGCRWPTLECKWNKSKKQRGSWSAHHLSIQYSYLRDQRVSKVFLQYFLLPSMHHTSACYVCPHQVESHIRKLWLMVIMTEYHHDIMCFPVCTLQSIQVLSVYLKASVAMSSAPIRITSFLDSVLSQSSTLLGASHNSLLCFCLQLPRIFVASIHPQVKRQDVIQTSWRKSLRHPLAYMNE